MITRVNGVLCSPLIDAAEEYRRVLASARAAIGPVHFSWYPYDSLGNMVHLTQLLEGTGFDLIETINGHTILDLGCADGDVAFFLESLGASVVAVDHPRGNQNNMAGIAAMSSQLQSRIQVRRMDLDSTPDFGPERYAFALALGLLYHLKNPFHFLESLARHTRFCILSTRVMRRLPNQSPDVSSVSVAYLLSEDELNGDNSNFWIFTEASLRRVFERSHWNLLAWTTVGDTKASTPHTLDNDERAFCLLESRWGELGLELGSGWHEPEDTGWRWTEKRFTARTPQGAGAARVFASVYVPDALIAAYGTVKLSLSVNGAAAEPEVYTAPGLHRFDRALPVRGTELHFEFNVSQSITCGSDERELALIVESMGLVPL